MIPDDAPVTELLRSWRAGKKEALDRLLPIVYRRLHELAERHMRQERADHTLRPTALVHEAYLELFSAKVDWQDRAHFLAVCARMMRRILVDHANALRRQKRGGDQYRITLDDNVPVLSNLGCDLLELHSALDRLAAVDKRRSDTLELLFFGGLTYAETALAVGISEATLHRDLKLAKAWLFKELKQ